MTDRLTALGARIERVALDPAAIDEQTFFRMARPLYALAGWRARVSCSRVTALVKRMRDADDGSMVGLPNARAALTEAVAELEANVGRVERAAILRKRAPVAHAAWLRRAWEIVVLASRTLDDLEQGTRDEEALAAAKGADTMALLAPLALGNTNDGMELVTDVPTRPLPEAESEARLVELELAGIDRLLDAARAERSVLGRKRRLLVAARQRILEACAALPIERTGARARMDGLAREIARIDCLGRAGLSMDAGLVHQARFAAARGDARTAYAAFTALHGAALAEGDRRVGTLARQAIHRLSADGDPMSPAARDASLLRSATELLGDEILSEVRDAVAKGSARAAARTKSATTAADHDLAAAESLQFSPGADDEIARAAVAVGGCFEVGGALSPISVVEEERVLREVRHPTRRLELVPAQGIEDVADAVVTDPRTILLDLAAGRLLSRRFVREEARPVRKVRLHGEVRVYVLDGSGSMIGRRGRVRDALLLAELSTMLGRIRSPGGVRSTLYYRYFDTELAPVHRVDTVATVHEAVRDVAHAVHQGGTDIQRALLASLAQVETARELDPDLARAQIVLVTDGESPVDENVIVQARAGIRGIPVAVSVIALGEENPALRALVASQRAKGERAFYHFLDDDQLTAIVTGQLHDGIAIHLPASPHARAATVAADLAREIGPLLDELESLERERDVAALERLDDEAQARRETGVEGLLDEGASARVEALQRDRTALETRFARWFPAASAIETPVAGPPPDSPERDDVDAASSALASIAEIVTLVEGGGDLARRADAIELLERLLPDAGLTPARYRAVLREWPGAVAAPLRAIHDAVRD